MPQALYRKYRPSCFADLVGQNPIKITLQNELENNRIAHAYLFAGPRGIGKTTTARLLAKAVNCQKLKGAEPCNKCDFCQEINKGRSMDLIEIDAASHTGVDNVRENIIENSRFTPQRMKYKVFIIDEVHMLSISAFNALLKTLEEPPEHVIFILATTEIHRVPETIISRCQRFDFKRVNIEDLVKRLQYVAKSEKVTVEESLLKNIAYRAEGSVRDAEVLLSQVMALGEKEITEEKASLVIPRSNTKLVTEFFQYLIKQDSKAAIALINNLVEEGVNLQDFTKEIIEFLRRLLLFKVSGSISELAALSLDEKIVREVKQQLNLISTARLVEIIEKIITKLQELKYTQIIQLPLELAVLELCEKESEADQSVSSSEIGDNTKATSNPAAPLEKKKKEESAKKVTNQSAIFRKVKELWPDIVGKLRQNNHSISLSLEVGIPLSIRDSKLAIGFRYKFHAERIKNPEIRSIIEKVLEEMTGQPLKIQAEMLSDEEFNKMTQTATKESTSDDIWDQAVQVFGSDIVKEEGK